MNQKPIFIAGAHKSGTSLLLSLLNGHSQLFTFPTETHYFQNMNYWVDNEYRSQRPRSLSRDEIVERFCSNLRQWNVSEDRLGGSLATNVYDLVKFEQKFSNMKSDYDDKKRIETYFEALYYSITGKGIRINLRIVEKSVENAEFAEELSRIFPQAKFIHILRNPYANIVSLRRYKSINHGFPIIRRVIRTLYNNYYFMYRNHRTIPEYHLIKYEDLVSQPKTQLQKLCDYLEIPFEEILLTPTFGGETWEGNSAMERSFSGIDASGLDRWQDTITPMEVQYINKLFAFVLDDFKYQKFTIKGSFWRPAQGENFKRYFANRLYRFYLREWDTH